MDNALHTEILVIEDNEGDLLLLEEELAHLDFLNNLHIVHDGEAALQFLFQKEGFDNAPKPHIVFLDLNIPKIDGFGVLEKIRTTSEFDDIPVIILTGSKNPEDTKKCHDLGANGYFNKPVKTDILALEGLIALFKQNKDLWMEHTAKED